jgi:1-deoxy-D-xylulose-5-phosphate reductoisomerase
LFGAAESQIDVVIHPESIIHSLVEYVDGSVLAQLGNPDMRTPIACALAYPERMAAGVEWLDLVRAGQLNFSAPDETRFPCLALARRALRAGGNASTLLNAANEVAVAAFLDGTLRFDLIPALIEHVLDAVPQTPLSGLEEVFLADGAARDCATLWLERVAETRKQVATG